MKYLRLIIVLSAFLTLAAVAQDNVTVGAGVSKQNVRVGEQFIYQIQIDGTDNVQAPNTPVASGLKFTPAGQGANNQSSISIINGRRTVKRIRRYIINYQVIATKPGTLTIPPMQLTAAGKRYNVRAIRINVGAAAISDYIKLRYEISKETAYVGEPIEVKLVWYIRKEPKNLVFDVPYLTSKDYLISLPPTPGADATREDIALPITTLNTEQVYAKIGDGQLDGNNYQTVTVTTYITPVKPGVIKLPPATVSCGVVVGQKRGRSPFGDAFSDDFFSTSRPVLEDAFASTSSKQIKVLALPEKGKPRNFSGLVGEYSLHVKVDPAEASVGEPITLTVAIVSNSSLDQVQMPDLNQQRDIADNFKIPVDIADGKTVGDVKVFNQSVRAKNADVTEFPPIELSYFNTKTGRYETAKSNAVPLRITAAKAVTAADIQGGGVVWGNNKTELESVRGGLAYNYIDSDALITQGCGFSSWVTSPEWLLTLILPPVVFLVLLSLLILQRYRENTSSVRKASNALKGFKIKTRGVEKDSQAAEVMLQALQDYFASRLGLEVASITYSDVESELLACGVDSKSLLNLKKVFDFCEASRYAGGAVGGGISVKFVKGVCALLEQIEKSL